MLTKFFLASSIAFTRASSSAAVWSTVSNETPPTLFAPFAVAESIILLAKKTVF